MEELKKCTFCGCKMESNEIGVIFGDHKKGCYFYFIDHQIDFDFYNNEEDKNLLLEAWNRRVKND